MVQSSNSGSIGGASGAQRLRRRADARRVGILHAAARVFRARGFAAAGMRDIADAAGLSPGNLYHYFRGKDDILFFCQDRSLDRFLDALAQAQRARGPVPQRLERLAAAHVLCLVDDPRPTSRWTRCRPSSGRGSSPSAIATNAAWGRS